MVPRIMIFLSRDCKGNKDINRREKKISSKSPKGPRKKYEAKVYRHSWV